MAGSPIEIDSRIAIMMVKNAKEAIGYTVNIMDGEGKGNFEESELFRFAKVVYPQWQVSNSTAAACTSFNQGNNFPHHPG